MLEYVFDGLSYPLSFTMSHKRYIGKVEFYDDAEIFHSRSQRS